MRRGEEVGQGRRNPFAEEKAKGLRCGTAHEGDYDVMIIIAIIAIIIIVINCDYYYCYYYCGHGSGCY